MNHCEFPAATKGTLCVRCGFELRRDYGALPSRVCDKQDEALPKMGLGDMVAAGLSKVGITKPLVEAIVGGPCGCDERQEALNEMGKKIGL